MNISLQAPSVPALDRFNFHSASARTARHAKEIPDADREERAVTAAGHLNIGGGRQAGMQEVLDALGLAVNRGEKLRLVITTMIVVAVMSFSCVALGVAARSQIYVHCALWVVWFAWLGWIFPNHRNKVVNESPRWAYRAALYRHIMPGFSLIGAQLTAPIAIGIVYQEPPSRPAWLVTAIALLIVGTFIMAYSVYALGLAATAFVYEYSEAPPAQIPGSIYSLVRHPIFVGGIVATIGGGFAFDAPLPRIIALINVASMPFYAVLEDRRLRKVFGAKSYDYCSTYPRFIPGLKPIFYARIFAPADSVRR